MSQYLSFFAAAMLWAASASAANTHYVLGCDLKNRNTVSIQVKEGSSDYSDYEALIYSPGGYYRNYGHKPGHLLAKVGGLGADESKMGRLIFKNQKNTFELNLDVNSRRGSVIERAVTMDGLLVFRHSRLGVDERVTCTVASSM